MTYEPVNATWPATLPATTATEAGEETTMHLRRRAAGVSRRIDGWKALGPGQVSARGWHYLGV